MQSLIAGAGAGAISNFLLYPWQRIKIQMQVTHQDKTHHVSISHAIKTIKRTQGVEGFYKGLKPMAIGSALSYAIYFYVYEKTKVLFKSQSTVNSLVSSAIAGAITSVFVNPFWMLQTRLALSKENSSFFGMLREILEKEGPSSLWKGLSTSLILVSNPIIQFCVYQWLLKLFTGKSSTYRSNIENKKTDLLIFLLAALSKAIATIFTYPYTIIRTFQHLKPHDKTMFDITKEMIDKEGFRCLFKGMSAKLIQTVFNAAFMMVIYERLVRTLAKVLARGGK